MVVFVSAGLGLVAADCGGRSHHSPRNSAAGGAGRAATRMIAAEQLRMSAAQRRAHHPLIWPLLSRRCRRQARHAQPVTHGDREPVSGRSCGREFARPATFLERAVAWGQRWGGGNTAPMVAPWLVSASYWTSSWLYSSRMPLNAASASACCLPQSPPASIAASAV